MTSPTRNVRIHAKTTADGRGLLELRQDLDKAAKGADSLGGSMADMEGDAKSLEAQIASTKVRIRELGEEYEATGDKSIFRDLGKERGHLRQLERIVAEMGEVGEQAATSFATSFARAGSIRLGPALVAFLGGAVVAAAPGIGAMLAGTIAGAIGTGGLAAGILSATKDPGVRAAAKGFGDAISKEFFSGGAAFAQPTIAALAELQDAFMDMNVPDALAKLAPTMDEIAHGIGDAGRRAMPGFNAALDRMGPFASVAESGIANLGDSIGDFANLVTESEGSLTGLDLAFRLVSGSIRLAGAYLKVFSDITDGFASANAAAFGSLSGLLRGGGFDAFADGAAKLSSVWLDIGKDLPDKKIFKVGEAVDSATGAVKTGTYYWQAYAAQIDAVNNALEESISKSLAQDNATLGLQSAILDLNEAIKDNGRDWRTTTEAGIANRRALLNAVEAAERKRQADIENGVSADTANAAYQRQIDKLKEIARKAGISEDALKDLAGDYAINVIIKTKGSIPHHTSDFGGEVFPGNKRQHGGPVFPGIPYEINEAGRETVTFPAPGMVHPANLTPAGGASQTIRLEIGGRPSGHLESLFVQWMTDALSREVGRRGGTLAAIGVR